MTSAQRDGVGMPPAGAVVLWQRRDDGVLIAADWFLLGAPWDCSGTGRGEQAAPHALRAAGLSALVGRDLGGAAAELARLPTELRRVDAATVVGDPEAAAQRAAGWLASMGRGVWLHLDLDVLDPELLPAVTYPQPGGLDWDQLAVVPEALARSPHCLGSASPTSDRTWTPPVKLAVHVLDVLERTLP